MSYPAGYACYHSMRKPSHPDLNKITYCLFYMRSACPKLIHRKIVSGGKEKHYARLYLPALPGRCSGTLVTTIPGRKKRAAFKRNAVWLWRKCSHQWATTNSGRITVRV